MPTGSTMQATKTAERHHALRASSSPRQTSSLAHATQAGRTRAKFRKFRYSTLYGRRHDRERISFHVNLAANKLLNLRDHGRLVRGLATAARVSRLYGYKSGKSAGLSVPWPRIGGVSNEIPPRLEPIARNRRSSPAGGCRFMR